MQAVQIIPSTETLSSPAPAHQGRFAGIVAKAEAAIERIGQYIDQGYVLQCACSFGKDSSVVLVLMLEAIRRRVEAGQVVQTAYVSHSNTGIENPAMDSYTEAMMTYLEGYCLRTKLPVQVVKVTPSLTSSFAYSTIGRGTLPVFPGTSRSCSVDWKLRPQQKAIRQLLSTLQNPGELITLVGTRFSESAVRGAKMRERGDDADSLVLKEEGFYSAAVIADWDVTHVWELLMACEPRRGGPYRTFVEDFSWCLELYKDANEGTCAIVTGDGGNKASCCSRFGCAWCLVSGERDKSMEAMIATAPSKHGHMQGISQFRQFLHDTRWDMECRAWMGRRVSEAGYIGLSHGVYSAEMRRDILRYLLTLDVLEEERAEEDDARLFRGEIEKTDSNQILAGITFQFITPQKLIAIDYIWSLTFGFDHAFPALREWYEIRILGKRYPIPKVEAIERATIQAARWFKVDEHYGPANMPGLQDAYLEATNSQRYPDRPPVRTIRDRYKGETRRIVYYEEAEEMEIDPADAVLFVDGFDELYEMAQYLPPTDSAKFYLNKGLVKLAKGKAADYDEMARRAQYWNLLDIELAGADLREHVMANSISNQEHDLVLHELKEQAQAAARVVPDTFDMFN